MNPRTETGPPIWKRSEKSVPRDLPRPQRRPERAASDRVYSVCEFYGLVADIERPTSPLATPSPTFASTSPL